MNGHAAILGDGFRRSGGSNDVGMVSHLDMMHYAPPKRKCLLHSPSGYLWFMDQIEIGKRLAAARALYFSSAKSAAEAMGIPVATYIQHENGTRGFRAPTAERYAKRFKTQPEWLLYGRGDPPKPTQLSDVELAAMIEIALLELPAGTPLGEFPRLVAPALREQIERFQADRESPDYQGSTTVRDKAVRSLEPTRPT